MKTTRHSNPLLFGAALLGLCFDVLVTRDGKVVTKSGQGVTKAGAGDYFSEGDQQATLDPDIPYSVTETEAGPLVSKTVQRAINQLNMVPLVFQHITNDIGFKICDVTPDKQLQGLIHLHRLTATNVASAGVFINEIDGEGGKQYTFHIGLDLSSVYHEITFAPTVGEWETHIYENNEDF